MAFTIDVSLKSPDLTFKTTTYPKLHQKTNCTERKILDRIFSKWNWTDFQFLCRNL